MEDTNQDKEGIKVYEIGYLIMSSVPAEKVADDVLAIKGILTKHSATVISEEEPVLSTLAYEMTKKVGAANQRFNEGYFGWIKFSMSMDEIEAAKKALDSHPHMLRMLLITTIKENTYLGKRIKDPVSIPVQPEQVKDVVGREDDVIAVVPASVEEVDKSIDEMVKGA